MSKVSLNPVRYYDISDIYTASTDNRPLYDISNNISSLNDALTILGFYQELYASQDTEPPGGFTPFTCVAVSKSNTLIPVDVSLSSLTVDYSQLPIYLVIESLGSSLYKCISFSSTISVPSSSNGFLFESIGKSLKIGPGGALVDEIYFDLYYSNLSYQQISVGKVLTQTTFSFGGNQVNTLSDSRFISKNRNDSTTGLVTRLIDLQDSHMAVLSTILPESIPLSNSTSLFTSYVNSVGGGTLATPPSKSPVYFSYRELRTDSLTGNLAGDTISLLNEVHFAPISVVPESTDTSLLTSGVNVDSLLKFTTNYVLHAPSYSQALNEDNQDVHTSLTLTRSTSALNLTALPFTYSPASVDSTFLIDPEILTYLSSTPSAGVSFYNFQSNSTNPALGGGYLGFAQDGGVNGVDPTTFTDQKGPTDFFNGSNTLVLYSKKATSNTSLGAASLYLLSDGYLILGSPNGVFCKNTPRLGYEITNKDYVDNSISTIATDVLQRIPYTGTTIDKPITGALYFSPLNTISPNTVLQFNNYSNTDFESNQTFRFMVLNNPGTFALIQAATPVADPGGSPNDVITRGFLAPVIAGVTAGVLVNSLTTNTTQDIVSTKTITSGNGLVVATGASVSINNTDGTGTISSVIKTNKSYFSVQTTGVGDYVKLLSKATEVGDVDNVVVTKGFLTATAGLSVAAEFNATPVYAMWFNHSIPVPSTAFSEFNNWHCITQGYPDESSLLNFSSFFSLDGDGILTYIYATPGLFIIESSDNKSTTGGPSVVAESVIARKRSGIVVKCDYNSSVVSSGWLAGSSLTGGRCSAIVRLQNGDKLAIMSKMSDNGSASISLLRLITV